MKKKKLLIVSIVAALVIALAVCIIVFSGNNSDKSSSKDSNAQKYKQAIEYLEDEKYEEAYEIFVKLGDYKDSEQYLNRFHFVPTQIVANSWGDTETIAISLGDNNLPKTVVRTATYFTGSNCYEYSYDKNGNIECVTEIDLTGGSTITTYFYDSNKNLVNKVAKNSSGYTQTATYSYDKNGNLIKYNDYYSNTTNFTYDQNNNLIKSVSGNMIYAYTYDKNNNLIESEYTYDGKLVSKTEYSYDKQGRLIQEVITVINGGITYTNGTTTKEYTYDKDGNLIRVTETFSYDSNTKTVDYEYAFVYVPYDMTKEAFDEMIASVLEEVY